MATRKNLNINPACTNNVVGWGGGSTPTRQTGLSGFPSGVTTGARYTTGTFAITQTGTEASMPGKTYTASFYIRDNGGLGVAASQLYLGFNLSSGGPDESNFVNIGPYSTGVVTRVSITATAPTNATSMYLIIDGNNFSVRPCDISAVLMERVGTLDTYFDGSFAGASWDGTAGNSSSTLSGGITGNLGLVSETDSALSVGRKKSKLLSITSETDTAQSTTRRKSKTLGIPSESDTLFTITARKLKSIGQVVETDSALGITRRKLKTVGIPSEADTGQVTGKKKSKGLGQASETDLPLGFGHVITSPLGLPTETDTALPLGKRKLRTLGIPSETDSALGTWGKKKAVRLGLPFETDVSLALVLPDVVPVVPDLVVRTGLITTTVTTGRTTLTVRTDTP